MTAATILLDVDGTLVDSVDFHARAWTEALARFGVFAEVTEVRAQVGKGGDQLLPMFLSPAQIDRFGDDLVDWREQHFRRAYLPDVRAFPGVAEALGRLRHRGHRIVLATSGKRQDALYFCHLAHIEQLVDDMITGEDVENSKPCPDIFEAALKIAGVDAVRAVAVGDSPWDAVAACRAGVRAIGVRSGGFPDDVLTWAGCTEIYDSVVDLTGVQSL